MSELFESSPQSKREPGSLSILQSRITAYGRENNISIARLNQRIMTEVMFGTLNRARQLNIIPMYLAKGGMSLELRFGIRARASRDLDLGILTAGLPLLEIFDHAISVGFCDFTLDRSSASEYLQNVNTHRMKVKISYRGRSFGTLAVDLNEATHETPVTLEQSAFLTQLGFPGPLHVNLLDPYIQLAHKLHGATEPDRDEYINQRYRDMLDVLVMFTDPFWQPDLSRLRKEVVAEFQRRPRHKEWPPTFTLRDEWRSGLTSDAKAIEFATSDPDELAERFTDILGIIEAAI